YYYGKCKEIGVKVSRFDEKTDFSDCTEIVDCIFGTGFHGMPEGIFADAIKAINQSGCPVISVDINSGLDGDDGSTVLCVRSNLTVSIGSYKTGHFLGSAKDVIGGLVNVDIGIEPICVRAYLLEEKDVTAALRPRRHDSHKGSYGYVSILGGCMAYAGAVKLANMSCAALRAGCGVAKLIVPASIAPSVAPYLLESTLALLPDENGHALFDPVRLDAVLAGQRALAIGMGWGQSPQNAEILSHILKQYSIPVVIDADGLNTLAKMEKTILSETKCTVILTPHPKEMERLSGIPIAEIHKNPVAFAETFAKKYGVCLLLKGTCTVVTDGEETYLVNRGCAGMATAGSGDVLSGVLAGLLGYAPPTPLTVACGAYIAGLAGELAERDSNSVSMLASDTVAHIGEAISRIT
ncbi:MAG: NAD(P)H-hydrate dehydratase, partial [Clostridia bacterium]|nr:NAD(P)H-hydrate dehydratase [Clostridia bacterium]